MLRRLINTLTETSIQNQPEVRRSSIINKNSIKFQWLLQAAPCFPVDAKNISIIVNPSLFYNYLLEGCKTSKNRITLSSLYIGTGSLEQKLIDSVGENENFRNNQLIVNILLDFHRGSRFEKNSRSVLKPLLEKNDEHCTVSLYHSPYMRGTIKKLMPQRFNELIGLQHMKLYIFDDTLVISGANLSNDYFTNRQDRYFVIKNKQLCDFYDGLVKKVQQFSLRMDKNNNLNMPSGWSLLPYEGSREKYIEEARFLIDNYLQEARSIQKDQLDNGCDTWIFPLIQMGQLGIFYDEQITNKILSETLAGSKLRITTGYFNLTNKYMETIIHKSKAQTEILMAHPKANGFWEAKGIAGGIPLAYSLIAKKFKETCDHCNQTNRIKLYEYLKPGWTFHGKGLWYYSEGEKLPCLALIGSPNFGERSVKRDLETQIAIVTENNNLKQSLHDESEYLFKTSKSAETERKVPLWIYFMVRLFRNYF